MVLCNVLQLYFFNCFYFFVGGRPVVSLPIGYCAEQVAGGSSIITSKAMTQILSPHLDPWYNAIIERSGSDIKKAPDEDKFHDIAFQK